jgi:hypothetical protein
MVILNKAKYLDPGHLILIKSLKEENEWHKRPLFNQPDIYMSKYQFHI